MNMQNVLGQVMVKVKVQKVIISFILYILTHLNNTFECFKG